ncbi:MAG: hypothetical protein CMA27_05025 [Euryarchaeota archaeon]|nr:hypothetical protein [Euryarchaeota archaeon]|tara:strand:- start:86 stop:400 length:315 start_codon:yes stop_codon:yes gene_type:complete
MGKEEILKAIKNAEKNAAKTLADAETKASSILSDARVKATELIQEQQEAINVNSRSTISDAKSKAQTEADKVIKQGDKEILEITEKGAKQRKKAIDSVIDSFMK